MKKKTLSRILSLVLAGSLFLPLIACGDASSDIEDESGRTVTEALATETQEETINPNFVDELPDLDYGKSEISILTTERSEAVDELYSENKPGELISNAVYERNIAVEERLNVVLDVQMGGGSDPRYVPETIHKLITSGDNAYQMVAGASYAMAPYSVQGDYVNLNSVNHLNLQKEYWSQGYNEIATWGDGYQYLGTGSTALSLFRLMFVTLYDKTMVSDLKIPDPYETTLNGDWTMDHQLGLVQGLYRDNGNGVRDEEDFYGFVSGPEQSSDSYWTSTFVDILAKDENNEIYYNEDLSKLSGVVDKVLALYGSKGSYIYGPSLDNTDNNEIIDMFANGKTFMVTTLILKLETRLRDYSGEYVILPMPKYDAQQAEYRTCVQDKVTGYAIPNTVSADEQGMIGAVLECMMSESYKTVVDAYYNTALSSQYLGNPESKIMLDLIYESAAIAPHQLYTSCLEVDILTMMREIVGANENTVNSTIKKKSRVIRNNLIDLNNAFRNIHS